MKMATDPNIVLTVQHLWKQFFFKTALHDLSFEVQRGHLVGVLGENGSGKTTLLRMLAGVLLPSSGKIELDGVRSSHRMRAMTAYLPDVDPYYSHWTIQELMRFLSVFIPNGIFKNQEGSWIF